MRDPAVSMVLQELRDIIDNRLGSFIDAEQAIGLMEVKDERFFNHIKERISNARDLDNLVNVILSNLYLLSFKH